MKDIPLIYIKCTFPGCFEADQEIKFCLTMILVAGKDVEVQEEQFLRRPTEGYSLLTQRAVVF